MTLRNRTLVVQLSACCLLLFCAWPLSAQAPSKSTAGRAASPDKVVATGGEKEAEQLVMAFVKEHQPELADLLHFLKMKKSKDYDEAMRESRKVRERLLGIKDRDPELYEVELALWKNAAQIRLLAAAASAKSKKLTEDDRSRLESLLKRENELSIERLTIEKARMESRLSQLTQQLTRRQEQADSQLNKSMKTWETRIERSSKPRKKDADTP